MHRLTSYARQPFLAHGREAGQPPTGRWVGDAQTKVGTRFGHHRQRAGDNHHITFLAGKADCRRNRRCLFNVLTECCKRLRQKIGQHSPWQRELCTDPSRGLIGQWPHEWFGTCVVEHPDDDCDASGGDVSRHGRTERFGRDRRVHTVEDDSQTGRGGNRLETSGGWTPRRSACLAASSIAAPWPNAVPCAGHDESGVFGLMQANERCLKAVHPAPRPNHGEPLFVALDDPNATPTRSLLPTSRALLDTPSAHRARDVPHWVAPHPHWGAGHPSGPRALLE